MLNSPIEKSLEKIYPDFFISQTSSGTSALVSILLALKKHKSNKNEVIIPSVVCPAVLHAVNFVGLKPVFVDMETTFFNMDLNSIKSKIGKRTLAIICVHCYGLAADIFKIKIQSAINLYELSKFPTNFKTSLLKITVDEAIKQPYFIKLLYALVLFRFNLYGINPSFSLEISKRDFIVIWLNI